MRESCRICEEEVCHFCFEDEREDTEEEEFYARWECSPDNFG